MRPGETRQLWQSLRWSKADADCSRPIQNRILESEARQSENQVISYKLPDIIIPKSAITMLKLLQYQTTLIFLLSAAERSETSIYRGWKHVIDDGIVTCLVLRLLCLEPGWGRKYKTNWCHNNETEAATTIQGIKDSRQGKGSISSAMMQGFSLNNYITAINIVKTCVSFRMETRKIGIVMNWMLIDRFYGLLSLIAFGIQKSN